MDFDVDLQHPNFARELTSLGATGAVHYGPLGTPMPVGMSAYLTPIVPLGWMNDEGLTEAIAEEKNSFTPWQSRGPIRESYSSQEFTFAATLWTIGGLANAMRYGVREDQMTWNEEEQFAEFDQGGELPEDIRFMLPIDVLDGQKHRRFILPSASVAEKGDVTYYKDTLVGYPFTWRANLDPALGYSIKRRFKEGWKPGTTGSLLAGTNVGQDLGDWSASVTAPVEPPTEPTD